MTVQEIAEQSLKNLLASLGFSADIEVTETALKVKDQFAALIDAFLREVKEA